MIINFDSGVSMNFQGSLQVETNTVSGIWLIPLDNKNVRDQLEKLYERNFKDEKEIFGKFTFKVPLHELITFNEHRTKDELKSYLDHMGQKVKEKKQHMLKEIAPDQVSKQYFDLDKELKTVILPEYDTKITNLRGIYSLNEEFELPIELEDLQIDYFGVIYKKSYVSRI